MGKINLTNWYTYRMVWHNALVVHIMPIIILELLDYDVTRWTQKGHSPATLDEQRTSL